MTVKPSVSDFQILATDPSAVAAFYGDLFGWQINADNTLGYRRIEPVNAGGVGGGIWPAPPHASNFVQLFIRVGNVSQYCETAKSLGATVIVAPQQLPDGDELAILRDPFGMSFGILRKDPVPAGPRGGTNA